MSDSKPPSTDASFWKTQPFKIIELTKAEAPDVDDDREWYRYVISQGDKPITGLRQGSKRSVKAAVEEVVMRLNERRLGKTGRSATSRKAEQTGTDQNDK
ncbi:MAG: hypothetical protein ACE5KS_04255 [Woeseiaceae bacterium]